MKYKILFLLMLTLFVITGERCGKNPLVKVKVHGRVLNYLTLEPLDASVVLYSHDVSTVNPMPPKTLETTHTSEDGSFSFDSPSSKRQYQIEVHGQNSNLTFNDAFNLDLNKGKENDLGDIFSGVNTFSCQITLNPVTSSTLDIFNVISDIPRLHFPPGVKSTFQVKKIYNRLAFTSNDSSFRFEISKTLNGAVSNSTISIPLNGLAPVSTTITY